jgi:ATP/maltotriose-dependent transcriptional regulator MalT
MDVVLRKRDPDSGVIEKFVNAVTKIAPHAAAVHAWTEAASAEEVLSAINSRLDRHNEKEQAATAKVELKPNFDSAKPLESLGLTPREAEVLLWIAQEKSNADIGTILGCAENTVKVHIARFFEKLGFENRNAATSQALEVLSKPSPRHRD